MSAVAQRNSAGFDADHFRFHFRTPVRNRATAGQPASPSIGDRFDKTIEVGFSDRVLPLDQEAAATAAAIAAARKQAGKPNDLRDTLIAGIVVSRRAEIATRSVRHFSDLDVRVIDPWQVN